MSDYQPEHTVDANYFIHWEQRALKAERECNELRAEVERLTPFVGLFEKWHTIAAEKYAEVKRMRALVEDALRGLHNDFEPDNQSALYKRIRAALEQKP